MATRRSFEETGGSPDEDAFAALFGGALGGEAGDESPLIKPPVGDPDLDGAVLPGQGPDESGPIGNRESPRELLGQQTPTLPRGVTVEEQMPEPMNLGDMFGGAEAGQNFSTPLPPKSPTPTAAKPPQPFVTPPESGAMPQGGATRRAVSPGAQSALFGDESNSPMFGRAGGLMGGGKGVIGAGEGGPEATDMMLNLMRMLKRGQMV